MDVNYRFWVDYVVRREPAKVLDFGCGDALVVAELRARGIDCHGSDVFYDGMAYDTSGPLGDLLERGIVMHHQPGEAIPFPDATFDLIISNQVLEHVPDLAWAAAELERVLKPGGTMRHHFPSREVIREGHIGIPLAHRLPRGRLRTAYTATLRRLGFGILVGANPSGEVPPREWARRTLEWIDRYCFYRPYHEIAHTFSAFAITPGEAEYCRFRAGRTRLRPLLTHAENMQTRLLRRLAFMALEMRRHS